MDTGTTAFMLACIIDYNLVLLACRIQPLIPAQAAPSFRMFISLR